MNIFSSFKLESNNQNTFRIGLGSGFLLYYFYGILDYFLMPVHYHIAWIIRFAFLGPILTVPFILSYRKWYQIYIDKTINVLIYISQLGIFLMIFTAIPVEKAYEDYYVGLILVILWAAFIFRMASNALFILVLFTIIVYNIYMIFYQKLLSFGKSSDQFAIFINNDTFLIASGFIAIAGSILIRNYQKKITEEKTRLNHALQKAKESDQIKTSFLNTMSHEIRTPLNGIIGFSSILINEPEIDGKSEMAEAINRQGYQLLNVLTSILEFSELQSKDDLGTQELISISDHKQYLEKTFTHLQNKLEKYSNSFILDIDHKCDLQFIYIFRNKFHSVLSAIIENAIKFSEKGPIKVGIEIVNGSNVVWYIKDEGIGITNEQDYDIFNNFSQMESGHNRKFGGIGMGLSISKRIINLMEGDIWYERNKKIGTTFYISLPNSYRKV